MTTTPRSHQTHCTCCGGRDIRWAKPVRWMLPRSIREMGRHGETVSIMICPACDRIPVSES